MILLKLALIAAAQHVPMPDPIGPGKTAWLVATVWHSEWCPAGNVRLDLQTGRYLFTPTARVRDCHRAGLQRPVLSGRLAGPRLRLIRQAFTRAAREGLKTEACRNYEPQTEIVVSNGGTPLMMLTIGNSSGWAPEDLGCWTPAANALYERLEVTFRSPAGR
jgi:hypothetical protein